MSFSIETDFPGGNACSISLEVNGDTTRIAFAPDPHGGPETLWFHFKVRRTVPCAPSTLELSLEHSYNMLGGHQPQHLRPVIRYAESDWQRLPAPRIEEQADGRARVLWTIAAPPTSAEVAVCFPYGTNDLDALLQASDDYWKCDEIGVGQRGTPLLRLANDYGRLENERPGLYLIARQHSGETPGSWALDGFLHHLAKRGDGAPLTWAVPLSDPDGVRYGDYGKDRFPYDINRAWGHPPMRHETLALRWDINRWSHRCRPTLAVDFHAPGACETDGIYCFLSEAEKNCDWYPQLHRCIEDICTALTPALASPNFERVARYKSRWETPNFAQFIIAEYNVPALSLEIPYALCGERVLTRDDYRGAGACIAEAILQSDLLRLQHLQCRSGTPQWV
jgi:hypothetical protein